MNGGEFTSTDIYRRFAELPHSIREIGMQNALIRQIMELYARGEIITKEEALCRMIVELSRNWESVRKDYDRVMLTQVMTRTMDR